MQEPRQSPEHARDNCVLIPVHNLLLDLLYDLNTSVSRQETQANLLMSSSFLAISYLYHMHGEVKGYIY